MVGGVMAVPSSSTTMTTRHPGHARCMWCARVDHPAQLPEVNASQHAAKSCKLPEIRHPRIPGLEFPPLVLAERRERRSVLQFVNPQDDNTCIVGRDIRRHRVGGGTRTHAPEL